MTFAQEEKYIYGSSRLGVLNESIYLFGSVTLTDDMSEQLHIIGQRTYELTNHLGNVLSVISDKPIPTNEAPIAFEHDFNATNESSDTIYANDFSSGYTGFFADSGITLSLSSGRLLVYNVPHLYAAYYPLNTLMTAGHTYRMKFKVERGGGGPVSVDVDDGTTVFGSSLCSGDGYYEFYCTPTNTTGLQWKFSSPNTATDPRHFYLDDLFIEDVTGVTTASPFTSNTTASVSIDNDKMKVSASSSSGEVFYEMPTVAGDSYKVTCYIDLNSAGDVTLYAKKQSGGTNFNSVTATVNDTYEMIFTAENTLTKIAILNGSGGARDFYVDNFVVEDILVNHDFTSRSFPMNSNSSIVLSLTGGRLKSTGAVNTAQTYQNVPTVIGSTYRVTCTLDLDNGGDLAFLARNVSSGTTIKSLVISTNNTYSFDFIAEETNTQIAIRNDDAATRDFYIDDLTVEEVMVNGYVADIRQASDYSPFGVTLHGRNLTKAGAEKFRYGFQGQEHDDEVSGNGNSYTAEFWQYDPRLGRRWNLDPVKKEFESPYAAFANNPVWLIDPNGADTLNGNTLLPKVNELNKMEAVINSLQKIVESQIAGRNNILKQIEGIENKQQLSELLIDYNPFTSNPLSKPVGAHIKGNSAAISALKARFIGMEFQINNNIDQLNARINSYNFELNKIDLEMRGLDNDDNMFIGGQKQSVFLEQNDDQNHRALFRLEVDGRAYRFGTAQNRETKSLIVKLNHFELVQQLRPSFELLGISPQEALKSLPEGSRSNSVIQYGFKKFMRKL